MGEKTRGRHRQPDGNDGDSMPSFSIENLTMLMRNDSRGCVAHDAHAEGAATGSRVVEIDSQVPRVYYWWRSNEGRDTSWRVDIGNAG